MNFDETFKYINNLINDLQNEMKIDRLWNKETVLIDYYICLTSIQEKLKITYNNNLYEYIEKDMDKFEKNISNNNFKIKEKCNLYNLDKEDFLAIKLHKYNENYYLISCKTKMIYDLATFNFICQWGDIGHETEGIEFPEELIPTKCNNCDNTDIKFTNCPFSEELYNYMNYGWWCKSCLIQAANEI